MIDTAPFTVDDEIERVIADNETASTAEGDTCQVCGTPLFYSGRGRHPRFCDDHKPGRKSDTAPTGRTSSRQSNIIRSSFSSQWKLLAVTVGTFVNGVDGQILFGGEPKLTESVVHLSETNPRFRKAMLTFAEASVYSEIAAALTPMALLIAANHGLKMPDVMIKSFAKDLGFGVENES